MAFSDPIFNLLQWDESHAGEPLDLTDYVETFFDDFSSPVTVCNANSTNGSGLCKWYSAARNDVGGVAKVKSIQAIPSPYVWDSAAGTMTLEMSKLADGTWQTGMVSTINNQQTTGFMQTMGYWEVRCKLPEGVGTDINGVWPAALWLRSPWSHEPALEIDVQEAYGGPDRDGHHSTIHLGGVYHKANYTGLDKQAAIWPNPTDRDLFSGGYRVFGCKISEKEGVRMYYQGKETCRFPWSEHFRTPLAILIDLAMHTKEDYTLCASPQRLVIDYVKAMQYVPEVSIIRDDVTEEEPTGDFRSYNVEVEVDVNDINSNISNISHEIIEDSRGKRLIFSANVKTNLIPAVIEGNGSVGLSLWANGKAPFQWYRDGVAIPGATAQGYMVVEADDDKLITCVDSSTVHSNAIKATWVRITPFTNATAILDIDRQNDRYWYNGQRYTRAEFQALPWVPDDITSLISPVAWPSDGTAPFPGFDLVNGAVIVSATLQDNNLDTPLISFHNGTNQEGMGISVRWSSETPWSTFGATSAGLQQASIQSSAGNNWVAGVQSTVAFKYKQDDFYSIDNAGVMKFDKLGVVPKVTKMTLGSNFKGANTAIGSIDRLTIFGGNVPAMDIEAILGLDVLSVDYGLSENDAIEARDIFGDGFPAILNARTTGRTTLYRQQKRGVFTPIVVSAATDLVEVEGVQLVDYKGDGKFGLFLSDQDPGKIYLLAPDVPGVYDGTYTRTGPLNTVSRYFIQDMVPYKFPGDDRESIMYTWEGRRTAEGGIGKLRWNGTAWEDTVICALEGAYNISLTKFQNGDWLIGARHASNANAKSGIYRMTDAGVLTPLYLSAEDWKQVSIGDFFGNGKEDIVANQGGVNLATKFFLFDANNGYAKTDIEIGKILRYGCQPAGFKVNGRDAVIVSGDPYLEIWAWNGTAWALYKSPRKVAAPYKNDDRPARMNIFRQSGNDLVWANSTGFRVNIIRCTP